VFTNYISRPAGDCSDDYRCKRHGGLIYMLGGTSTSRWDVQNGVYEDLDPCVIITLTNSKFVYRDRGHDHATYTRTSKEEAAKY